MLHVVLPGQGAYQRRVALRGADGGARLQYTSHHASISRAHSNLQAWKICLSLEEGRAGLRGIVIFPGPVVMAELGATFAREVRKEICENNKPSENTFRAS